MSKFTFLLFRGDDGRLITVQSYRAGIRDHGACHRRCGDGSGGWRCAIKVKMGTVCINNFFRKMVW